ARLLAEPLARHRHARRLRDAGDLLGRLLAAGVEDPETPRLGDGPAAALPGGVLDLDGGLGLPAAVAGPPAVEQALAHALQPRGPPQGLADLALQVRRRAARSGPVQRLGDGVELAVRPALLAARGAARLGALGLGVEAPGGLVAPVLEGPLGPLEQPPGP